MDIKVEMKQGTPAINRRVEMKLAHSTNVPESCPSGLHGMPKNVHSICDIREGRESHCIFKIIACPTMVCEDIFFFLLT